MTSPELVFDRSLDAAYGMPVRLSPLVTRILAPNPGLFTFRGTGVHVVGAGNAVAVIDPGPDLPEHVAALKTALKDRRVSDILVTHAHNDHSPAARALAQWSGAKIYAFGPYSSRPGDGDVEEGADRTFVPDATLRDGDVIAGDGFTLEGVFTPGHTAGHMCYALREEKALFTGDHVMGWSTSVVAPPDGDMALYMASLEKLIARDDAILYPTHGSPIRDPKPFLRAYLAHRRAREAQLLVALAEGAAAIPALVARLYAGLEPGLRAAAGQSLRAHLVKLRQERTVVDDNGVWRLA